MKNLYMSTLVLLIATITFGQNVIAETDSFAMEEPVDIAVIETPEKTRVTIGKNEVLIVEENGDTVTVGLGSKGISIVEEEDGVKIKVLEMEKPDIAEKAGKTGEGRA